jgi:hypothetical protein
MTATYTFDIFSTLDGYGSYTAKADTGASKVPSSSTTALLCTAQSSGWSSGPTPIGSSRSCWARAPSPTSSVRGPGRSGGRGRTQVNRGWRVVAI